MKILSIGNSFSTDAHRWLHLLAKGNGIDMETTNLFIGGCSLQTHWENYTCNAANYELEQNGLETDRMMSIPTALAYGDWDVITVQQVSHMSGQPETYYPYLTDLVKVIRQSCPNAKLYLHQTWAYETDSQHKGFVNYDLDQKQMYDRILETTTDAAARMGAEIIPVCQTVQKLRQNVKAFDYANGGLSLCRDGFHLSYDYGRYAAAATWLRTLTGIRVKPIQLEDMDMAILEDITSVVNSI